MTQRISSWWRARTTVDTPDRGAISAYLVIIAVAVLALAGLVVDGGQALAARGTAAAVAQHAARVGADALSPASLRGAGSPLVDGRAARVAAEAVLATSAVTGEITVTPTTVTVTVHTTRTTAVLAFIGIDQVGGSATATAFPLTGITTGSR